MDRKRPVLGGSVPFPQYLGWSWTGCGPRLPVFGAKNRTEPDLRTLWLSHTESWNTIFGHTSFTQPLTIHQPSKDLDHPHLSFCPMRHSTSHPCPHPHSHSLHLLISITPLVPYAVHWSRALYRSMHKASNRCHQKPIPRVAKQAVHRPSS